MFPPFIDSFGNQFTAVIINVVGTVLGGVITGVFNAFSTGFLAPLFKSIAAALGIPV
ncbi:MAG: hypothetical protein IPK83_02850 [Planctomycetes bacterium]|nr:hypothetical protein [Planctomycetota bacterium]